MIRANTIKALFVGFMSDSTEVKEHFYTHPYRDATYVKTPIRGKGYAFIYVAETGTNTYCVYHPEILEEFSGGYPEWAEDIARGEGVYLDRKRGVYIEDVGIESLGLRIWNVAYATARLHIKLDEIKEGEAQEREERLETLKIKLDAVKEGKTQ